MVVGGRTRPWTWAGALLLAGCLDGPASDATSSSTTTTGGSTGPEQTSGDADTSIETSTTSTTGDSDSDSIGTTTVTTGPNTTTPAPTCSDGDKNGGESDVDCGGPCPGCSEGQACVDPDDCASTLCNAGTCVGFECRSDDDCGAFASQCARGVCELDTHTCVSAPDHQGEPCDDGDLCTAGDLCGAGVCVSGPALDCSEFDSACTMGQCDPESGSCGAIDVREGAICDDGNGCTFNEACTQGACVAPPSEGAVYYTDFSSMAGWTVQAPWEIGPAMASPMTTAGADPASDHTDTGDNGVAGLEIGGLDPMAAHAYLCLTSPPIDTTSIGGTLWLTFWRHLHTPASPGVMNKIEVWNGAAWKPVQSGYPAVVNDADWNFQKFNITGSGAADFQVRFCVQRSMGSPDVAGWTIDDLALAPAACTP